MNTRQVKTTTALVAAGLAATFAASTVHADTLRYAHGWPAQSAFGKAIAPLPELLEEASDGELSARVFPGNLLNMMEMPAGLRDGMADMGFVVPVYTPSDFPITNMLADTAMLYEVDGSEGNISAAFTGALMDFIINGCPECQTEFERQNQVYTVGGGAPRYHLMCTRPVTDLDDLDGTRVRVAGPQWSRWVEHFGARSVSLPGAEVFEALNQGVVECAVTNGAELRGLGLVDVVTDITQAPLGIYGGGLVGNVNRDTWQGLSPEQRRAVLRVGAAISARGTTFYNNDARASLDEALERGANLHQASPEMVEFAREFIREEVASLPQRYNRAFGVENGEQIIERFLPYMDKWMELAGDVTDQDELEQLFWEEVLEQVDVNTYGL